MNTGPVCALCREVLEPAWKVCPGCGAPTGSGPVSCPTCGGAVKTGWKVCPRCSTPLGTIATPVPGPISPGGPAPGSAASAFVSGTGGGTAPEAAVPVTSVDVPLNPGDVLAGDYVVQKKLGSGGFGSVYLANNRISGTCAVKVVAAGFGTADQQALKSVQQEFGLGAQIEDLTHVIRVFNPQEFTFQGLSLLVLPMEFADGGSLRGWLQANPDPALRRGDALRLFREACLGVASVHRAGLVHLDVKPENFLLAGGKVKVSDFGLGRFVNEQFRRNPEQSLRQAVGTPQYMSPEQFRSARQRDVGPAADVYGLGVVLYELLDGALPFDGSPAELREKHLGQEPPRLRGVAEKWWPIVSRCLAKDPIARYRDVTEIVRDLDNLERGLAVTSDVSCTKCGHVNGNRKAQVCESCGQNLVAAGLFRTCPECQLKLRKDVPKCDDCGADVETHYQLVEATEEYWKARDTEPDVAMELLKRRMKLGGAPVEARGEKTLAAELARLRGQHEETGKLANQATAAQGSGQIDTAIGHWQGVLKLFPKHARAQTEVARLRKSLAEFAKLKERAAAQADAGEFGDAAASLRKALDLAPGDPEVKQQHAEAEERRERYEKALDQANQALSRLALLPARKAVEKMRTAAPKGSQPAALETKIRKAIEKVDGLLEAATEAVAEGRFEKAEAALEEIGKLQSDRSEAGALGAELAETRVAYEAAMERATRALGEGQLEQALSAISKALAVCPSSRAALDLRSRAESQSTGSRSVAESVRKRIAAAEFVEAAQELGQLRGLSAAIGEAETVRLAEIRRKYEPLMEEAMKGESAGDLARALRAAKEALATCPQSSAAAGLVRAVEARTRSWQPLEETVRRALAAGEFVAARKSIEDLRRQWPLNEGLEGLVEETDAAETDFTEALQSARIAESEGDIESAAVSVEAAKTVCPGSAVASRMGAEFERRKARFPQHLAAANERARSADFAAAQTELAAARTLWPANPNLARAEDDVRATRATYERHMKQAADALAEGRFKDNAEMYEAVQNVQAAQKACPDAKEPAELLRRIELESAHGAASETVAATTSGGGLRILAIAAVVVVVGVAALGWSLRKDSKSPETPPVAAATDTVASASETAAPVAAPSAVVSGELTEAAAREKLKAFLVDNGKMPAGEELFSFERDGDGWEGIYAEEGRFLGMGRIDARTGECALRDNAGELVGKDAGSSGTVEIPVEGEWAAYRAPYNDAVDKFNAGDLDGALESAKKAVALGPESARTWDLAAKIAATRKEWDSVIEWGEKSLSLEADNPSLYGPLMNAYKVRGNSEKAALYERKFVAANPDKPEILYNQAVDFYNKKDFGNAEQILGRLLERSPEYANAHFLLGMTCANLRKGSETKRHLEEYVRLDPNGRDAAMARKVLEAFK